MREILKNEKPLGTMEVRTLRMLMLTDHPGHRTTCSRDRFRARCRVGASGAALIGLAFAGCSAATDGSSSATTGDETPVVVVTYSILGDLVTQLVGDAARVEVVVPNGQDPHDYAPSARDVQSMADASLIVANGLDLEEGMVDVLHGIDADGVPVFYATDHVTLRDIDPGHEDGVDAGHGDDAEDPHIWTDPVLIAEMLDELTAELQAALGVPLDAPLRLLQADLTALDAEVRSIMSRIDDGRCTLVTGHESLGYFAARYGCDVIGAVIPGLSSTATASARDVADLLEIARDANVSAIFTEVGTPSQVAAQVAGELAVPLVELPSHLLPATEGEARGRYQTFIIDLATAIADALTAPPEP